MSPVPDCVGVGLVEAEQRLREAGFSVLSEDITPANAPARYQHLRVVRQRLTDDQTIQLTVAAFLGQPSPDPVEIQLPDAPAGGVYVVEMQLPESLEIQVGNLGQLALDAGSYLYAGSAKKHLAARLGRHMQAHKTLRWHVDYLTSRVMPARGFVWPWSQGLECRIAQQLANVGRAVAGFGSSDCHCTGHLIRLRGGSSGWWRKLRSVPPPSYVIPCPEQDPPSSGW